MTLTATRSRCACALTFDTARVPVFDFQVQVLMDPAADHARASAAGPPDTVPQFFEQVELIVPGQQAGVQEQDRGVGPGELLLDPRHRPADQHHQLRPVPVAGVGVGPQDEGPIDAGLARGLAEGVDDQPVGVDQVTYKALWLGVFGLPRLLDGRGSPLGDRIALTFLVVISYPWVITWSRVFCASSPRGAGPGPALPNVPPITPQNVRSSATGARVEWRTRSAGSAAQPRRR